MRDFMHPDRVVIGSENERADDRIRDIYNVLYLIERHLSLRALKRPK